jgi:uncharacterized protein
MNATQRNPFLLATDNSPQLIPLLRANPSLASEQDAHGYSLIHAAASYNHLDLLRVLVRDFRVPVDLKDEDGETALFVCETVESAKLLVEELRINSKVRGCEGKTAREKIEAEGDFPDVAAYLYELESKPSIQDDGVSTHETSTINIASQGQPLRAPEGITISMGAMNPDEVGELVDPEFRRKIEDLAARSDFQGEEGQRQLRDLITEAVHATVGEERDVRRRTR